MKSAQGRRGEIELEKPDFTSPVYLPLNENRKEEFQQKLELVGGKVFLSGSIDEAVQKFQEIILENRWTDMFCKDDMLQKYFSGKIGCSSDNQSFDQMQVGITRCEFLVAHLGAILVSSAQTSGRRMNVFPEIHVIFAHEEQLIDYLENGLEKIRKKYDGHLPSLISVITGPSRTADIEKTLVMGMHGPKSLFVFLCSKPF
ncbi:MAG: LUD domain-containing protein [Prolixibacteraceae bacterium]|nr:LUD domain-containing protein [Prolixibacteraceae bacterium]